MRNVLTKLFWKLGLQEPLRAAWTSDVHREIKRAGGDLREGLHQMRTELETIKSAMKKLRLHQKQLVPALTDLKALDQRVERLELISRTDRQQRQRFASLPERLQLARIRSHVLEAVAGAPILTDPFPHLVVEELLPRDFYELLLEGLPPVTFFTEGGPGRQNWTLRGHLAPAFSYEIWTFMDAKVVAEALVPTIAERFASHLRDHCAAVVGPEFRRDAEALTLQHSGGRLMLRRPGYHFAPHLDPKRAFLTTLLYLARPGDQETYGTQIFRVDRPFVASYTKAYYPELDGLTCDLVKTIPFRANSALVFLNAQAAHGADIPSDAQPSTLERYAYQFYIGPGERALKDLIKRLSPERQEEWRRAAPSMEVRRAAAAGRRSV